MTLLFFFLRSGFVSARDSCMTFHVLLAMLLVLHSLPTMQLAPVP